LVLIYRAARIAPAHKEIAMSISITCPAVLEALSQGRYIFAVHGRSDRWQRRRPDRRRRRGRRRDEPYVIGVPQEFRLEEFAEPENLMAAYLLLQRFGGHAPGDDYLSFADFDPDEIYGALRQVSRAIMEDSYRPYTTRPVRILKDDGRYRELRLQRITDRTVAKALQLCLDRYWRSELPGLGRSVWDLYALMELTMLERQALHTGDRRRAGLFPQRQDRERAVLLRTAHHPAGPHPADGNRDPGPRGPWAYGRPGSGITHQSGRRGTICPHRPGARAGRYSSGTSAAAAIR
jgi:hypothetical protein